MTKRLTCYLRPYRRRWGFSQQELGYLIVGAKSRTLVARLENATTAPSLASAFALQMIFGMEAIELFPALFAEVESSVIARANDLFNQLQGDASPQTKVKLDFLEELFVRTQQKDKSNAQI